VPNPHRLTEVMERFAAELRTVIGTDHETTLRQSVALKQSSMHQVHNIGGRADPAFVVTYNLAVAYIHNAGQVKMAAQTGHLPVLNIELPQLIRRLHHPLIRHAEEPWFLTSRCGMRRPSSLQSRYTYFLLILRRKRVLSTRVIFR
jgi:hypothetical protein